MAVHAGEPHARRGVALEAAIAEASRRIAPLWPLKHFVAVNPFLGFTDRSFHATCALLRRVARVEMLMPRAFYREAIASGAVETRDVEDALALAASWRWNAPTTVDDVRAALHEERSDAGALAARVPTVSEVLDSLASGDRIRSGTAFMVDDISKFLAAYFDDGQSAWRLPWRGLRPYAAWREAMRYDRNPEVHGVPDFRAIVGALPDDPYDAIAAIADAQGVPERALADYLHQALASIGGWASHARYLQWERELQGESDDAIVDLLAIRLSFGYALFAQHRDDAFALEWNRAMQRAALEPRDDRLGGDPDLALDIVAHEAYERAFARRFIGRLGAAPTPTPSAPRVQAVFCIDVRSEIFRRALEAADPNVQTLGFAGFFGFPIEYVRIGQHRGGAQCPALILPSHVVHEAVAGASPEENERVLSLRRLRRRAAKAWKAFRSAAVSSFVFVETAGLLSGLKLASDALALTRPVRDGASDGLDPAVRDHLAPAIDPAAFVDLAESALRGMSLVDGFAPTVLFVGHGSRSVNNPYASGLDCGACGGHSGEANARVAAMVLNDPGVRAELRERGIAIPDDTRFVAALHDTTTDEVRLFDTAESDETLDDLRRALREAGAAARAERAAKLGARAASELSQRARDWSQVRPEWGLAGNAALVVAPRARTRGLDLEGRAFLHEYDSANDADGRVLEAILTAPLVVASWINLQYFGSTVNNRVFGSGNKVLHNVVGAFGVLEGNGGDLRTGLPMQSLHDGAEFVHEPLRLNAFVEAPLDALSRAISAHAAVRDLLDNRWVHLFRLGPEGVTHRYVGAGAWESVSP